jgi:hypothetical protein
MVGDRSTLAESLAARREPAETKGVQEFNTRCLLSELSEPGAIIPVWKQLGEVTEYEDAATKSYAP